MNKSSKRMNGEKQAVAVQQKNTYTFHIKDKKIVIEATSAEQAQIELAKIIKSE